MQSLGLILDLPFVVCAISSVCCQTNDAEIPPLCQILGLLLAPEWVSSLLGHPVGEAGLIFQGSTCSWPVSAEGHFTSLGHRSPELERCVRG